MDYQGKYNSTTVQSFLINLVHPAMDVKYKYYKTKDVEKAQDLQQFFQDLKNTAKGRASNNIISNLLMDGLLDELDQLGKAQWKNYNVNKLFTRPGGLTFERELSDVIAAVAASLTEEDLDLIQIRKTINIGHQKGNVIDEDFSSQLSQKILKATGIKTQKKIQIDADNTKKLYYLTQVEGKSDIDVNSFRIDIKANANSYLLYIWKLLATASFSAKNYNSMSWDEKLKILVENHHEKLSIGKSNIIRSLYGSLNSLGIWDHNTIISAIYAGYWAATKYNQQPVMTHFYHLRYIYELTGAGIMYDGKMSNEVNFLIYNDPNGEIFVKSTAGIVSDVLDNHPAFRGNPFKDITIKKAYFHE